ncbi:MAG: hypothetical protein NT123_23620 [Proteobacteria bacterium]|nr:hypothetical protein [Pseudomonadota bacterium]
MIPRLYLAGKIGQNDWRHALIPGLRDHSWADGPLDAVAFEYVGPFFVACDHGCFHGPNGHGMRNGCAPIGFAHKRIIRLNLAAIHNADLVFAYITSSDCYGTLFELGWAARGGKRIVIAFAPGIDHLDFWFSAKQVAATHKGVTPEALPALLKVEITKTQTTLVLGGAGSFGKAHNRKNYG